MNLKYFLFVQENFNSCLNLSYLPNNKEGVNIDITGEKIVPVGTASINDKLNTVTTSTKV